MPPILDILNIREHQIIKSSEQEILPNLDVYLDSEEVSSEVLKKCYSRLEEGRVITGRGYHWSRPRNIAVLNNFGGIENTFDDFGEEWVIKRYSPLQKKILELNLPYLNKIPGGLGDTMVFTHIPKYAKEIAGVDEVIVRSEYRREEYKDFLFKTPYVDVCEPPLEEYKNWKKDFPWMEHDVMVRSFYPYTGNGVTANYFDIALEFYNLSIGERLTPPYLYYSPNVIPKLQDKIIWDPNYYSAYGACILSKRRILEYVKDKKIDFQLPVIGGVNDNFLNYTLPGVPFLKTSGRLEELCDVIHSCKEFWGMLTGSNVVAYALNKPINVLIGEWKPIDIYPTPEHYLWLFPNIHTYHFFK